MVWHSWTQTTRPCKAQERGGRVKSVGIFEAKFGQDTQPVGSVIIDRDARRAKNSSREGVQLRRRGRILRPHDACAVVRVERGGEPDEVVVQKVKLQVAAVRLFFFAEKKGLANLKG